ncbi:DUF3992 domain-containing protein [Kroppenstedtia pulmonis]|uniref:DUF3992 domain-containing protein n=1 Tax=Kroppenstedtia pulmonis TaxID=1380685 RepID=A0A7D4C6K6_9BACL|nr:S-Ena type endospore appendage [Kroppenstedtia pulmonis]QKG84456.1 DUF3992 domain-containing protein [Kroppenstedtia pulmonis]
MYECKVRNRNTRNRRLKKRKIKCKGPQHRKCMHKFRKKPAKKQKGTPVSHKLCGNILLNDQHTLEIMEIWKKRIKQDATLTLSVFNSTGSTAPLQVLVNRKEEKSDTFTVPPGNTLSTTVCNVDSIRVFRIDKGKVEGKFCLDIVFPFSAKKQIRSHSIRFSQEELAGV